MATFVENAAGDLTVTVEASGLTPGKHGLHVHAVGSCVGPDFTTAGGHFNPLSKRHGLQTSDGSHGGDLPNLIVGPDGRGRFSMTVASMKLSAGVLSLMDPDGSAIVIHAAEDDGMTDATGNSGARIACGIVTMGNAPAPAAALPAPAVRAPNTGDAGLEPSNDNRLNCNRTEKARAVLLRAVSLTAHGALPMLPALTTEG